MRHAIRSQLQASLPGRGAEKLALTVREGDRGYALRWVFRGYQSADPIDSSRHPMLKPNGREAQAGCLHYKPVTTAGSAVFTAGL